MTRPGRAAVPAFGALASAVLLLGARGFDQGAPPGQLGAGFWPRMILAGLALACLVRVVSIARSTGSGPRGVASSTALPPISWPTLGAAAALILLYVLLAPVAGFALVTAGFIAAFMRLCGARSLAVIGTAAVGGTVALLYLFVKAVYLPLPKGDGPFEAVTLALYRALRLF